jgi:type II secretory pathway pseudopilin PulG
MSLKHRLRSETGFGLVEVLVTAMVVLILASGLLAGFNAASHATGRTKAKSVAMTLAQKDQERMRAMPIATLANVDETATTDVCDVNGAGCVKYTIASIAQWVSDSLGLESCTTPNAGLDYLKITSTVTWPNLGTGKPVTTQSMIAPAVGALGADKGSLAVQVVRADGLTGVNGATVTLGGLASDTGVTNSAGCVVWGLLAAGNYTASLNQAGFVGVQGTQAVTQPAGVVDDSLSTTTILYDGAASAKITFYSQIGATRYTEKQSQVTLKQSQMSPVTRVFSTSDGLPAAAITATSLFPFKTGSPGGPYSVYPGGCPGAESPAPISLADLTPAANTDYDLRIPAFDFQVAVGGVVSSAATTMTKIVPVTLNCDNPLPSAVPTLPVNASGRPADPGFPYGTYDVCAQALVGGVLRNEKLPATDVDVPEVKLTKGGTAGVINITASSALGAC